MNFEEYKRKLLEEDERNRLSELQTKYNGVSTPDYSNMSLRDELQTRFDLDELNELQQKYGVQQAQTSQPAYTATPQSTPQPSAWDNTLRKAEQLASGALDGLSLGWADELEGAASAVGYGLASLNPNWNKTGESAWDAMKRGYVQGRDNRRQVLEQGLQENPVATTLAQMTGAFASPIKFKGYSATAPLEVKNKINRFNAVANGLAYGIGSGQDNWQNYAKQLAVGTIGGYIGYKAPNLAFGKAANPAIRTSFNTFGTQAAQSGVDAIQNWYNNYNKF